jgi:hypothetical protein
MIVSDGNRERAVYELANKLVEKWIENLDEELEAEGGNPLDKVTLSAYATAAYTLYSRLKSVVEGNGGSFTPLNMSSKPGAD